MGSRIIFSMDGVNLSEKSLENIARHISLAIYGHHNYVCKKEEHDPTSWHINSSTNDFWLYKIEGNKLSLNARYVDEKRLKEILDKALPS